MKRVAVLGSTGSVGANTLKLVGERPERFAVSTLVAHRSAEVLLEQVRLFRPRSACLVQGDGPPPGWPAGTELRTGAEGVLEALEIAAPDLVLNAITGAAGLPASEWALRRGVPLALANKESLVIAGAWLMELARQHSTPILPVDSEHCAIHQCLRDEARPAVRRVYLTGSGGPFRQRPVREFASITPQEALRHPTWTMGPRITVGSATMMNKAFEVVEAHWLFDLAPEQIEVVIHPQSIVHSMVEFVDGSILAQLGLPDMRVPILYCLAWPERAPFAFEGFDLARFRNLEFLPVEPERYPALALGHEVVRRGGDSGAVLNAADEVATEMFLAGRIPFPEIARGVAELVHAHSPRPLRGLDDALAADRAARARARQRLGQGSPA
ncbi:MAG: 1-deoxy-D-xylulose-5-phosphate reductoisomerase [Planctomycetes bacterium]|nr:1-deoxy-D-xylulose-5-phosphate reductoisomerase [Planctomycetota bacterium]